MVSIIVPIYNVEEYLPKCIESIIHQTYRDIEIILIDDGSQDDCGRICDTYAKEDNRIRVFHKENGGLSDARNFGIECASGDYLLFVDSDDWIEQDMVELLVDIAKENKTDIVECGIFLEFPERVVTDLGIDNKRYDNTEDLVKAQQKGYFKPYVWNKLYCKSCFTNIRFPKGHVYEGIATIYKIFMNATSAQTFSKPLYHYRKKRQGSITQTKTMGNLVDFWIANKAQNDIFMTDSRFNKDEELIDLLLYHCATAIARTWRWCYNKTDWEKEKYAVFLKDMHTFACQRLPVFGMRTWPLYLRFSVFMCRFKNKFVFALLFYMSKIYRWRLPIDKMIKSFNSFKQKQV